MVDLHVHIKQYPSFVISFFLAEMGIKVDTIKKGVVDMYSSSAQSQVDESSVWYHEGSADLMAARFRIADYSMPRYMYMQLIGCM